MPKREVLLRAGDPRAQPGASAEHFDLYDDALLPDRGHRARAGTTTTERWIVTTDRGDAHARPASSCMANGPLHRPKLPGIPGIDDVQGPHVPHQPLGLRLHRRRHRREPRPGSPTSASASSAPARPRCSACPHLGEAAEQLYVFQRTPSSIDVRDNRPTDPEWAAVARAGLAAASGWTTSTPSSPAASRTRTSSTTAGPTSSASCW